MYAVDDDSVTVTLNKVNISANISSNGKISGLTLQTSGTINATELFFNNTIFTSDSKASLLVDEVQNNAVLNVSNTIIGNATRIHGKSGIGGFVTRCLGRLMVRSSDINFAVVAED